MRDIDYGELYRQFNEGKSLAALARENNLVRQTITNNFIKSFDYNPIKASKTHELINKDNLADVFNEHESGESLSSLAKKYGVSRKFITKKLNESFNITTRVDGKLSVDSNYFERIDTADKAYWLGLMYADGYVSDNGRVELCLNDLEHVEKFKHALKSDHKIGIKKTLLNGNEYINYRIHTTDRKLNSDLKKHGCHNNKSLSINMPLLRCDLISHFIRGFFDGDGSLGLYSIRNKKHHVSQMSFSCASDSMINDIINILSDIGINCSVYQDKRSKVKSLRVNTIEGRLTFLDWVYKDSNESIRLNRKYNKSMEVIRYHRQ